MENKQPNIINVLDRMGKKLDEIGKRVDEIMDEIDINKPSNQSQPLTQLNDKEKNTRAMDIAFVMVIVVIFVFALVSLIKHRPYLM
jgi:multidrug efflux pump subunit AcrB